MELESTNQQSQPSPVSSQSPPNQNIVNNQRGNFILIMGIIVLVLVIGIGSYILGTKMVKPNPNSTSRSINQPTIQPIEDESPKEVASNEDKILYEDNGFSLYYPSSLEMYQTYVGDATQWKPKTADRIDNKEGLDALTLHESTNPLLYHLEQRLF